MSTAAQVDLTLDQGSDFGVQIYWVDGDRNPFTVLSPMRMEIKSDLGQVMYTLESDDDQPDPTLQTILYNSESGLIQLQIPASATAAFPPGLYSYDLWVTYQDNAVTNATRLRPLIRGNIYVNGRVTSVV
jgi:hypothetical protein